MPQFGEKSTNLLIVVSGEGKYFVTFVVVNNLGVLVLIGMNAMMNMGAVIDCNKRAITIEGETIPFGWINDKDDKPITVKTRTLLRKGMGTRVPINTRESVASEVFLCGERLGRRWSVHLRRQ